jgi:hypothetical protein
MRSGLTCRACVPRQVSLAANFTASLAVPATVVWVAGDAADCVRFVFTASSERALGGWALKYVFGSDPIPTPGAARMLWRELL